MRRFDPLRATRYVVARHNSQMVNRPWSEEEMANLASLSELWHASLKEQAQIFLDQISQHTSILKEAIQGYEHEIQALQDQVLTIHNELEYNKLQISELKNRIKSMEEEDNSQQIEPPVPYWKRLFGYLLVGFVSSLCTYVLTYWIMGNL